MRYLILVLLWCLPSTLQAGTVILGFDFPLASYSGTQFLLRIVTVQNGRPTQTERLIDPLPIQQCAGWPDPAKIATSLCAQVCLDPGDYTLTVFATRGNERSPGSNVLDLDFSTAMPCLPIRRPPPPPPPPPPHGSAEALVIANEVALGINQNGLNFANMVNLACVQWVIAGACVCPPNIPCVIVSYWEPGWIVEVVKKPGDTLVPILGEILQLVLSTSGTAILGAGGAANTGGPGHTNLQYAETHVYTFPQILGGPCTSCPGSSSSPTVHFASELDPIWRTAVATPSPLDLLQQIGVWGRLYPRGGHAIHGSEPVASGLLATRALDITRQPIGTPPNLDAHVVLQPINAGTPACLQLASPRKTSCMPAGFPPALWETGALSLRGRYAWLVWRQRVCCVKPASATCGITLPGVGGHGQNLCLLQAPGGP